MKKTLFALLALGSLAMGEFTGLDADKLTVADAKIGDSQSITSGNAAINWDTTVVSSPLKSYILTFSFNAIPDGDKDAFLRLDTTAGWGLATQSSTTMYIASNVWNVTGDALTINTTDTFALTFTTIDSVGYAIISNLSDGSYVEISSNDNAGITEANFDINNNSNARIWTNDGTNKITMGEVASLAGLTLDQVRQVATTGTYTDTPAVPEPTTATLSLLALAGLAARRRRK